MEVRDLRGIQLLQEWCLVVADRRAHQVLTAKAPFGYECQQLRQQLAVDGGAGGTTWRTGAASAACSAAIRAASGTSASLPNRSRYVRKVGFSSTRPIGKAGCWS